MGKGRCSKRDRLLVRDNSRERRERGNVVQSQTRRETLKVLVACDVNA